jgi:hypothetical protein
MIDRYHIVEIHGPDEADVTIMRWGYAIFDSEKYIMREGFYRKREDAQAALIRLDPYGEQSMDHIHPVTPPWLQSA